METGWDMAFGGSGLDRAAGLRGRPGEIARLAADPRARFAALWRGKPLLRAAGPGPGPGSGDGPGDGGDPGGVAWLDAASPAFAQAGEEVFLGLDGAGPRFARDVSAWEPDEAPDTLGAFADPSEQRFPGLPDDHAFVELRAAMARLGARDAELAATAKGVLGWHAAHRFCARCGAASEAAMAGWRRDCPACGAAHFPRTDPVVIMLVTRGNALLLGRSPAWPEGMYSLLAGFVEPGETVEAAVRREVFEEAGVRVGRVGLLASQPWPFPASLMLGCRAEAASRDIVLDPEELEDALWASRERVAGVLAGADPSIRPPREGAIARALIRAWLRDDLG